ncbi:MAG: acyl-CoA synthetase [Gammaproteobacteria bacterium]|nr:acyl-CoA synthetase [Gammaproteobacteria bacterium]
MDKSTVGIYTQDLDKNQGNYTALSPLSFIARSAEVYPDHLAVIHGEHQFTWRQTYQRCCQLASALQKRGVGRGDTVAVMAPNIPAIYEAHFGVPMVGAVLNALNIRLDAKVLAFILEHGEAKVLLTDREFSSVMREALSLMKSPPLVIDIDDPLASGGECIGETDYETFLETGDPGFQWQGPEDEWEAISLNYTSGTTGNPKGVVYHHRGAYLNALSNATGWDMSHHPTYLWTLPMFHCNGWCFPWTLAALAGTSVCLRKVEAPAIYRAIADTRVTHFCGAPVVLNDLVNAPEDEKLALPHVVKTMTAGAPPPASILEKMDVAGFDVTHVYGLTETYGPSVMCAWKSEWNDLPPAEKATLKARQGIRYHALENVQVMDPDTLQVVPSDGETMGEIMFRGNIVMKGYLKNPSATEAAFRGGWFHSGDLAVRDPDGYIRIKDRSKDIIISGGENISSIEVEDILYRHPDVIEAAVIAQSDEKWGEVPCAFLLLRPEAEDLGEKEIMDYCRENMAHFKVPKKIVFTELPKTSTGKIQKFKLRDSLTR